MKQKTQPRTKPPEPEYGWKYEGISVSFLQNLDSLSTNN